MARRLKYEFSHQAGGRYYWYRAIPGDSRCEQISCGVEWFWNRPKVN